MTDELLPHYNRELAFFRRTASQFAENNPKIAGRLRMGASGSEDPHVERLIEAFAYLAARIRHKLDDDFPELTDALLGTLYPHYLAPIPSMAIIKFAFDPSQSVPTSGHTIPRNSEIETDPIDGEPCRFRTNYDVTMWPFEVRSSGLIGRPLPAPSTPRSTEAVAVVRIQLESLSDEMPIGELDLTSLRFFLNGPYPLIHPLYELIFNHTIEVALADSAEDRQPIVLDKECVRQVGFGRDEGLLPYSPRSALGYRLLTEFFSFPSKFLFFEIADIPTASLSRMGDRVELFLYLDRSSLDLEQAVSKETFQLYCTPMINLFRQRAEPIELTPSEYEYRVAPDARRPAATEVYSINEVIASSPAGDEVVFEPFFALRHGTAEPESTYWYSDRRPAEAAVGDVDHGTEVFLTLVDLDYRADVAPGWYLDVDSICLNRDLPGKLPFGGGQPALWLTDGEGPLGEIECLTAPTPTRRPPRRHGAMWRLISHLNLGHLSLVDGAEGGQALQEMLKLYNVNDSAETRDVIESILSVASRQAVGRVPGERRDGICRGVEVDIEFREESFSEKGLFLFASVLERFLALHCSVNSFSRLSILVRGGDGYMKRWRPRSGEQVLL